VLTQGRMGGPALSNRIGTLNKYTRKGGTGVISVTGCGGNPPLAVVWKLLA